MKWFAHLFDKQVRLTIIIIQWSEDFTSNKHAKEYESSEKDLAIFYRIRSIYSRMHDQVVWA